jgi:acyl-coenzyme A thioesterase PaaI-like protein
MSEQVIQRKAPMAGNTCWGCGQSNPQGLRIESRWEGEEAVCTWQGEAHHNAGRANVMNGGIIAALIDCHSMCAAVDAFSRRDTEAAGSAPAELFLGTVSLHVDYLAPTPIGQPLELRARITELTEKKAVVTCSVRSGGKETARGEVIGVRLPRA